VAAHDILAQRHQSRHQSSSLRVADACISDPLVNREGTEGWKSYPSVRKPSELTISFDYPHMLCKDKKDRQTSTVPFNLIEGDTPTTKLLHFDRRGGKMDHSNVLTSVIEGCFCGAEKMFGNVK
jgi:hypothetical protein